jgi:hypothetical protein
MTEEFAESRSQIVSAVLAGSWRRSNFPQLTISESQLDEVTPLLYGSGAGALGWWRVRESHLRTTASAGVLQQAYRLQVLQAEIHAEKIQKVFRLLRGAAIEPILVKGWAASSLYPEHGLRPYGDIDLLVKPEQYQTAVELLAGPGYNDCWVDLPRHCSELADRPVAQLFARSRLLPLGDSTVRVLSPEDHLALLAIHLLKHGAWRPLWFCDIGAVVEGLPPNFDWDLCLGANKRRALWIKCAIGLTSSLLGARIDQLPATIKGDLPRWLVKVVRREWQHPFAANKPPMNHPVPIGAQLRGGDGLIEALRQRWPNPILATVSINGAFNRFPRFPYQLSNCALRAMRLLLHSPRPE